MLSKVSINRLLEAADILEAFKPTKQNKFNISYWKQIPDEKDDHANACGTTACACGVIASQPKIRKRGFKLEYQQGFNDEKAVRVRGEEFYVRTANASLIYKDKDGYELDGFEAAAGYFGILYDDAKFLFSGSQYQQENVTAKTVAKRIRRFVTDESRKAA